MSICGPRNGRDRVLKGASAWKNSLIQKFSSHHNDNNEVKIVHKGMQSDFWPKSKAITLVFC